MKRVEYFPKKMAEREAALVASPASGQDWDRPTAPVRGFRRVGSGA
jgi:hypothetical protein